MMTFTESIKLIVKTYRELRQESAIRSSWPDGKVPDPNKPSSSAPPNYPSELRAMEESLARIAKAFAQRRQFLSYLEEYYAIYGDDAPSPDPPMGHRERTEAVLSEVGRTPVEVAALYGYRYPVSVERLRRKHRRDPKTGELTDRPLTANYREYPSKPQNGATASQVLAEVGSSPTDVMDKYGYSRVQTVRELRIRHGRDPETGEKLPV